MPGGGSLVAANHIYNVAPKDGTVIGLVAPTMPLEAVLGAANARFEPLKFNWIGRILPSPTSTFLWHNSPVKTVYDALKTEVLLGATAPQFRTFDLSQRAEQRRWREIQDGDGLQGLGRATLAMERGEVDGSSSSWDGLKAKHPAWVNDKKVRVIVQYTLKRHPELLDVPTGAELGRNPEEVRSFGSSRARPSSARSSWRRRSHRRTALRRSAGGFDATMKEPDFIRGPALGRRRSRSHDRGGIGR